MNLEKIKLIFYLALRYITTMTAFVKHRPSAFDQIPLEVIRTFIFPKLTYEERINLNQCLPVWDRIPKRMNIRSIEKHEQNTRVDIIKQYINEQEDLEGTLKIKKMTKLFKTLQEPRFFVIIERHSGFRQVVLAKIKEMVQQLIDMREEIELGVRLKLASELKKLLNKINTSGPYTDRIYTDVPSLSFQ